MAAHARDSDFSEHKFHRGHRPPNHVHSNHRHQPALVQFSYLAPSSLVFMIAGGIHGCEAQARYSVVSHASFLGLSLISVWSLKIR